MTCPMLSARLPFLACLITLPLWSAGLAAHAQLVPDATLGPEASQVNPATVRGLPADLIEGGAARGETLFHSFGEFNVAELQRVYFANPAGIENILSRVTGGNVSNILGTLGVNGGANLYLLNPNGIFFGPNAQLDISGAFFASTADGFLFPNGDIYSAVIPDLPPLLSVDIQPGLQLSMAQRGEIASNANLAVGQDLTLVGTDLSLTGQLRAGNDLNLQGDTVTIRDSMEQPFRAIAPGTLQIQGNQGVDIFVLNHPDSGLFSGGDMVLRSPTPVIGDARYYAGGRFAIEDLTSNPGDLASPHDPVVIANGDVVIGDYVGASLHVLAGGAVGLGNITINAPGNLDDTISPNSPSDFLAGLAEVELQDGSTFVIDGASRPTLDIRAGIDWNELVGFVPINEVFLPGTVAPTFQAPPTSNSILVGNIDASVDNSLVFLTNRFSPNRALAQAPIVIADITTNLDNGTAGDVIVDAASDILTARVDAFIGEGGIGNAGDIILLSEFGSINTTAGTLRSSTANGNAGQVRLVAEGDIVTNNVEAFVGAGGFGQTQGIDIISRSGSINTTAGTLSSSVQIGTAGPINLSAPISITTGGVDTFSTSNGGAGDIKIVTDGVYTLSNNTLRSQSSFDSGDGGNVDIRAGAIRLQDNAFVITDSQGNGLGGSIFLTTQDLQITGGSEVLTRAFSSGPAGNIIINPIDATQPSIVTLEGVAQPQPRVDAGGAPILDDEGLPILDGGFSSGLFSTSEQPQGGRPAVLNPGRGGLIQVNTDTLNVRNGAVISGRTRTSAAGGEIEINVDTLNLEGGGQILTTSFDSGPARGIVVNANNLVNITGFDANYNERFAEVRDFFFNSFVANDPDVVTPQEFVKYSFDSVNSAEIIIDPVSPNSGIQSGDTPEFVAVDNPFTNDLGVVSFVPNTSGPGASGNIEVNSPVVSFANRGGINASSTGLAPSGSITLRTNLLTMESGGAIQTSAFGRGTGGDIVVVPLDPNAPSRVSIQGALPVTVPPATPIILVPEPEGGYSSGLITTTESVDIAMLLDPYFNFNDLPVSNAQGGDISVTTDTLEISNGGTLNARTRSEGNAGQVILNVNDFSLTDGAQVVTAAFREGGAGSITVNATGVVDIRGTDATYEQRVETLSTAYRDYLSDYYTQFIFPSQKQVPLDYFLAQAGFRTPFATEFYIGPLSFVSGLQAQSGFQSIGDGSTQVTVTGSALNLNNQAEISTSTFGRANAGTIDINVAGALTASNTSSIRTEVQVGASGDGGDITVQANSLELLDGSQFISGVFRGSQTSGGSQPARQGDGGDIVVNADESIRLSGFTLQNEPDGQVVFVPSGFLAQTEQFANGNAGNVNVNTRNLSIENGASISALTANSRNAGDINIGIRDSALGLREDIVMERLTLTTGGTIIVDGPIDADGNVLIPNPGNPGNINLESREIILLNGGKIQARTASAADFANINLTANSLQLEGVRTALDPVGSCPTCNEISTAALGFDATGGNIRLQLASIRAVRPENSDIVANAVGTGGGGRIDVLLPTDSNGRSVFNLDAMFRLGAGRTIESDLDASSKLGAPGVVNTSEPTAVEPIVIPEEVDPAELIDRRCELIASGGQSEFSIVGRGGLPANPAARLEESTLLEDLGPETVAEGNSSQVTSDDAALAESPPEIIQEPQNWYVAEDGSVYLYAETPGSGRSLQWSVSCQAE